MRVPSHPALPWLAASGVLLMWASSFLVIRVAGNDFSPGAMTLLRVVAASIVLPGTDWTPRAVTRIPGGTA